MKPPIRFSPLVVHAMMLLAVAPALAFGAATDAAAGKRGEQPASASTAHRAARGNERTTGTTPPPTAPARHHGAGTEHRSSSHASDADATRQEHARRLVGDEAHRGDPNWRGAFCLDPGALCGGMLMPVDVGMTYKPQFPLLGELAPDDPAVLTLAKGWNDLPGDLLKLGAQRGHYFTLDDHGLQTYSCLLHPNALDRDAVRIVVEARVVCDDPVLDVRFGAEGDLLTARSTPADLGDGWFRYEFTIARAAPGEPLGDHLDMFEYSGKGLEVRFFKARALGVRGDVNLDGVADTRDAAVVLRNYDRSANPRYEDGDANLDGVIDLRDLDIVLGAITDG